VTMTAPDVDREIAELALRIRQRREQEGLTLGELAERSGVAPSTIQKVETGQMTPSVAVLFKIARGLGRAVSDFIRDGEPSRPLVHLRAEDRPRIGPRDGTSFERVSGDVPDPKLEMWRVQIDPGALGPRRPIQYQGEALVVCERGRPTLHVGEVEVALAAGDSLHFDASAGMSWKNEGSRSAVFTVTGTLPEQLRASLQSRSRRRSPGS